MSKIRKENFDVKIVVAGRTGTGKSTFANLITMMLLNNGIKVEYTQEFPDDNKFIEERLNVLREKNTKVEVVEINYQPNLKEKSGYEKLAKTFKNANESSSKRYYKPKIKKL